MLVVACLVATAPTVAVPARAAADTAAQSVIVPASLGASADWSVFGTATTLPRQTGNETDDNTGVIHESPDEVNGENELDHLLPYLLDEPNGDIGASTL